MRLPQWNSLHRLIEGKRDQADVRDADIALKEAAQVNTLFLEDLKRELGQ